PGRGTASGCRDGSPCPRRPHALRRRRRRLRLTLAFPFYRTYSNLWDKHKRAESREPGEEPAVEWPAYPGPAAHTADDCPTTTRDSRSLRPTHGSSQDQARPRLRRPWRGGRLP